MSATGRGALVAPAIGSAETSATLPAGANPAATSATLPAGAPVATSATLPERHNPSRNSVRVGQDNRAVILFVTVCAKERRPVFDNPAAADCIVKAWNATQDWVVGQYVVMPDHVHFCCAPGAWPIPDFHRWMAKWKAHVSRTFPGGARLSRPNDMGRDKRDPPGGHIGRDKRDPPLWQRSCWDTQLRRGENFAAKCDYIRDNPVRAGLVANAGDWPYQGKLRDLEWHDEI